MENKQLFDGMNSRRRGSHTFSRSLLLQAGRGFGFQWKGCFQGKFSSDLFCSPTQLYIRLFLIKHLDSFNHFLLPTFSFTNVYRSKIYFTYSPTASFSLLRWAELEVWQFILLWDSSVELRILTVIYLSCKELPERTKRL